MKKLLSLLAVLCLFTITSHAQTAASYAFSTLPAGTFASISATGTVAPTTYGDDVTQPNIPIGFTFVFCGTNCTTLSACSNGWLSLANSTSTQRTNSAANVVGPGMLMPYWDDLDGVAGTSTAYYSTTGAVGSRVFTFEWKHWQMYYSIFFGLITGSEGNANFQVKLYEGTNIIEYRYGTSDFASLVFASPAATIGIANSTTDYQTLPNVSASPTPSSSTFTTNLGSSPATNQIYRWSPACSLTTSASTSGTICSGSTLNLTGTIITGTATTFSWQGPAGYTSNVQSPSIPNATVSRSGTYSFTATSATCTAAIYTTTATVDTTPVATVSGTASICSGNAATITFTGTAGATVSYNINGGSALTALLSAAGTATVGTGTLTTGITATTVTYNITSVVLGTCTRTLSGSAVVTVNPQPSAITGVSAICAGGFNITLGSTPPGGTWTTDAPGVASINSATGMVTSGTSGTANITYTMPGGTGCRVTAPITVNSAPPAIGGSLQVCQSGGTTTLTNTLPGGTWSATPSSIAVIDPVSGLATGALPGSAAITYTLSGTCYTATTLTVNPTLGPITGPGAVCEGASISLTPPVPGGTWSATPASAGSVDPVTGVVTAGTAGTLTVTYLAPTNCSAIRVITVNPNPAVITGTPDVCLGYTTTVFNTSTPGTWSSANTGIATVNPATGVIRGAGTSSTLIVYTITGTGCYTSISSTVNPLPAPIGGPVTVCGGGAQITLTNTTPSGSWSNGPGTVAAIDPVSGIVTGGTAGTSPVTYTISATGCYITSNVVVLPIPAAITGPSGVCEAGSTITLADASAAGTWSITPAATASISGTGMVTGGAAGAATVTYTGGNGCFVTYPVTVNPLPAALTGIFSVCQMAVTTLSSTSGGGTWTSLNPFTATVGTGGDVHGVLGGNATIDYTLPTGCKTNAVVTVNVIPAAIGGNNYVCHGYTTVLTNAVSGGTWSSTPLAIATVDASGTVYGTTVGAATVTYTTGTNGCFTTKAINVNPIVPAAMTIGVSPSNTVCAGTTVTFTSNPVNGGTAPIIVWSVNGVILSGAANYSYVPADGDIIRCWFISSYDCAMPDTASDVVVMTVHPNVTPALSISTGGGDTVCVSALTTMAAVPVAGGSAPTYMWYVNLAPMGAGPTYPYVPNNGDVVTCVMTSNAFCRSLTTVSATKTLTVSALLTPLVSMTSSLGQTTCDGYPTTFSATQVNGGWSPAYQWSVDGTNTATGPVYTYAPANGETVAVQLTSSYPCLLTPTATTNMAMTVLPITQPVGVVSSQPGYIIPEGFYDTFTCTIVSGGGIAPTYQWYKSSVPQPGETNPVYITNNLHNGDSINCEVTNTDQCSGVSVFNYVHIIIGNNVGVNTVANTGNSFSLVPNPNNGTFAIHGTLATKGNEDLNLEITDMLGRTVYQGTTKTLNGTIDQQLNLGNFANGVYLLSIRSKDINTVLHFVIDK